MSDSSFIAPAWITEWMGIHEIILWGAADLRDFFTPSDEAGERFPFAISWAVRMNPQLMVSIQKGPNQTYTDEYARVNNRINVKNFWMSMPVTGGKKNTTFSSGFFLQFLFCPSV